ncbi:MAG: PilZ domain-containing protein [Candidatus Omnitrophota bacterium]
MKERRNKSRIAISFPVECNFLPKRNLFYTVSRDLSEEGAKILTENFVVTGEFVKVTINLIDQIVNLKAKVVWCNKERTGERYSAGINFVDLNGENKNKLWGFLSNSCKA